MDFGIIARPDAVAVPDAIRHPVEAVGQTPLRGAEIPADVRGEGFRSLPVPDAVEADEGVGDGVFPDVRGQAGGPLGETPLASPGEAGGEGRGDGLPQRPQAGGSRVAPPGLLDVGRVIRRAPPRRCPRRGVWAEVAAVRSRRRLGFSEELLAEALNAHDIAGVVEPSHRGFHMDDRLFSQSATITRCQRTVSSKCGGDK